MGDYQLKVTFGAETAGVTAGVDAVKDKVGGLGSLVETLGETFGALSSPIKAAFEIFDKFKEVIEPILDFSREMGKAAEETTRLSERLRTTAGDAQALQAMATVTGTKIDVFSDAMQGLDRTVAAAKTGGKEQNEALRAIGVSADGSHTKMQLLSAAMAKFSGMEDGPAKSALAMQLFGKAGADLLPVLNANKDQMGTFNTVLSDYGVINADAVSKGTELAGSWNTNALAMQGVNNVLTDALAPILTEVTDSINLLIKAFVQSYNQGGIVAVVFNDVTRAVEEVGAVINALVGIFSDLWDAVSEVTRDIANSIGDLFGVRMPGSIATGNVSLNLVKDTFVVLKDIVIVVIEVIRGHIEVFVGELRAFAEVLHDTFTLQWDRISNDWQAGMDSMAAKVEATAGRVAAAMAEARDAMAAAIRGQALAGPTAPHLNLSQGPGGGEGSPKEGAKTSHHGKTGHANTQTPDSSDQSDRPPAPLNMTAPAPPDSDGIIQAYQEIDGKIVAMSTDTETKKTAIARQGETQRSDIEKQAIAATSSLWAQNISKLLTLQQSFGATLKNIYNGMVNMVSQALTRMLQDWISAELSKTAAAIFGTGARTTAEEGGAARSTAISAATAIKQIAHSAGVAAAHVWAAVSSLPGGWIIAPALAAAALFGVIKLGQSIFSAEGGMGNVPYDNSPFLLHKNEMVLPASLATPLRAMLQGGGAANVNAPFAANDGSAGGDLHYHDHSGTMTPAQIVANRAAVAKAIRMAHREGHFAGTGIMF